MTIAEMVAEFHRKHGAPVERTPVSSGAICERRKLRLALVLEEAGELADALGLVIPTIGEARSVAMPNRVKVADALGDLLYVVYGAAIEWGIPLDDVVAEIHRSNMTKDVGAQRADGKITKGPGYEPPDLAGVIERARRGGQP